MFKLLPPLILYVIVTAEGRGFVNVITGDAPFLQTDVVPLIVAAGDCLTFTDVDEDEEGPPQPFAITETVAGPKKDGSHDTVPVVPVPEILFPAPVTDQV